MVATVRLDDVHENKLEKVAALLHKKKSDVLRDALDYYVITSYSIHYTKLYDCYK